MRYLFIDLDNTIYSPEDIHFNHIKPFADFVYLLIENDLNVDRNDFYKNFISFSLGELFAHYKIDIESFKNQFPKNRFFKDELKISPFSGYKELKNLSFPMFLVTTGLKEFQEQKISSLGIKNDFLKIVIDDPVFNPIGKKKAFQNLLNEFNLNKKDVWVIGDNPHSEILAGKELGLNTVLLDKKGKQISQVTTLQSLSEAAKFIKNT